MHHDTTLPGSPGYTFIDHGGGSHLPLLLACVTATTGPVLEIGIGHGSTPCLHSVCCPTRRLVSLEDSPQWVAIFNEWAVDGHELGLDNHENIARYSDPENIWGVRRWGVVFIDDSPGGRPRAEQLERFLPVADYVIMHDAQDTGDNYGPAMEVIERLKVPHHVMYKRFFPWTLAASLVRPIPVVP